MGGKFFLVILSAILAGCATSLPLPERRDEARTAALPSVMPAAPQPVAEPAETAPAFAGYRLVGDGQFLRAQGGDGAARSSGPGIVLAFEDTPISEVVSALIGDVLEARFSIDPQVNGRITLRSPTPVTPADLPSVLDAALRVHDASLIELGEGSYTVVPRARAGQYSGRLQLANNPAQAAGGTVVVPLRYLPAREMERLLRPLATSGESLFTDEARQLLFLNGDRQQVANLLSAVEMFDVDWLDGMSIAIHVLDATEPDVMIGELTAVFGGEHGPVGSQVEFLSIDRLNSVLILAQTPQRLRQAEEWIERLDIRADRGRWARVLSLTHANADSLAQRLTELFSADTGMAGTSIIIQADPDSNSLLVVADADGFAQVEALARELDRAPEQVMIEARIVEVVLNDDLRYGVQWFLDTRDGGNLVSTGSSSGSVSATLPGFAYTYSSDYVRAALSAIASVTDVETVSSPQIMALDNQPSLIQVGDQVPVITQSAVSVSDPDAPVVNSVEYRDAGVMLRVTPRISDDGSVLLEIVQDVSSVAETTTSGIDSPTIQQRRFETSISVSDGNTIALGGLIRTTRSQTRSGVPGLQRVPVVGNLFSETGDARRRTELVVFLTPRVVRSNEDAVRVTNDLRNQMQALRDRGFGSQ
jgi:general secretion pathway protein D